MQKIGNIKSSAKQGDRVTVYFSNGKSGEYIADHDLTSNTVAVIGNHAFSGDRSVRKSSEITNLLKTKNEYEEGGFDWGYLFELNEFTDLTVPFTAESWNYDETDGAFRPFGDGGGYFDTEQEIVDFYSSPFTGFIEDPPGLPFYDVEFQGENRFNLKGALEGQVSTGIPAGNYTNFAFTDGVFYNGLDLRTNDETFGSVELFIRNIFPDRQYWVRESVNQNSWSIIYREPVDIGDVFPVSITGASISIGGTGDGNDAQTFSFGINSFTSETESSRVASYIYRILEDGSTEELPNNFTLTSQQYNDFIADARAARDETFSAFNGAGYEALTYTLPNKNFEGNIYLGQEIIDGVASGSFSVSGNIPESISARGSNWTLGISGNASNNNMIRTYEATLFLIPIVAPRNPGKKEIYTQIRNNKKVLLHTIPFTEMWDGFMSPLSKSEVEVVIFCGKIREPDNSLVNEIINNQFSQQIGVPRLEVKTVFNRDWAQVRVYRLNSAGTIISTNVYNNPEPFELSELNWQKPWLNSYEDYRTIFFFLDSNPAAHFWEHKTRTGIINDLNSAYRTFYGDRSTEYIKTVDRTSALRRLIHYTSLGTLTPQGFVYLTPDDLYSTEVELDFSASFSTRLKPAPNFAIKEGLRTGNITKPIYYLTNGELVLRETTALYIQSEFTNQITIERPTEFPPLDLPDDLGDLQVGIKAIAFLDV